MVLVCRWKRSFGAILESTRSCMQTEPILRGHGTASFRQQRPPSAGCTKWVCLPSFQQAIDQPTAAVSLNGRLPHASAGCVRVSSSLELDTRTDKRQSLQLKIDHVEQKLGAMSCFEEHALPSSGEEKTGPSGGKDIRREMAAPVGWYSSHLF